MKLVRVMFATCLCLAPVPALAGEAAYTVRATELKEKPFMDARALATLAEKTRVDVIHRHGSWNQVKANGKTGWVKMLSLRFSTTQRKAGDSGFSALFNVARTGSSGSMTTTGIRGLSEEKLHNPQPNPQALKQLGEQAVSKEEAQRFAKSGGLTATKINYLPAPAK
ncbi:MAG: hypothetical protein OEV26_05840 [Gallionella sp.]|nr:hypothetical protein [Gallionella sp.]